MYLKKFKNCVNNEKNNARVSYSKSLLNRLLTFSCGGGGWRPEKPIASERQPSGRMSREPRAGLEVQTKPPRCAQVASVRSLFARAAAALPSGVCIQLLESGLPLCTAQLLIGWWRKLEAVVQVARGQKAASLGGASSRCPCVRHSTGESTNDCGVGGRVRKRAVLGEWMSVLFSQPLF